MLHVSPYDAPAIPADHPVLRAEADEFGLRHIADTGLIPVPLDTDWPNEAMRLNDRWSALRVWTIPEALHEVIAEGARAWFERRRAGVPQHLDDAGSALRIAYAVAHSNIESAVALYLITGYLVGWFYTSVHPEPPRETVDAWKQLAEDPGSATSQGPAHRTAVVQPAP